MSIDISTVKNNKYNIVESQSEPSRDNLWLRHSSNKVELLYYGTNGWESLI